MRHAPRGPAGRIRPAPSRNTSAGRPRPPRCETCTSTATAPYSVTPLRLRLPLSPRITRPPVPRAVQLRPSLGPGHGSTLTTTQHSLRPRGLALALCSGRILPPAPSILIRFPGAGFRPLFGPLPCGRLICAKPTKSLAVRACLPHPARFGRASFVPCPERRPRPPWRSIIRVGFSIPGGTLVALALAPALL